MEETCTTYFPPSGNPKGFDLDQDADSYEDCEFNGDVLITDDSNKLMEEFLSAYPFFEF